MSVKFSCPRCRATIKAPDTAIGKRAKCPKCGAPVQVPAAASDHEAPPADEAKLQFPCPSCHRRLTVAAAKAGRQGKCPHCLASLRIPDTPAVSDERLIPIPSSPEPESGAADDLFGALPSNPFGASPGDPFGELPGDPTGELKPLDVSANPLGFPGGATPTNPYAAPQFGAAPRQPAGKAQARSKVMGPAIGMIVVASISILGFLAYGGLQIAAGQIEPPPNMDEAAAMGYRIGFIAGFAIPLVLQLVVLVGAIQMLRMKSYGGAMTAAIIAILPCSAFCILNTPFGIWAVVVLNAADVKRAFR